MKFFKFSLLALGFMACSQQPDSELEIVRGRTVPITSPAYYNTVRIQAGFSGCTASIIGEKLILTAAHCVDDATAENINVIFERKDQVTTVEKTIGVNRVQMFKKEGAAFFPNFDIAWLELKERIPAPFKPMEVLRDPSQLSAETPIILAGYGQQKDDCSNTPNCSRVLLEGNTELKAYHDKAHILSLLVFYGDPKKNLSGACYGDSGGPAYAQVNGQWYLIGVTNGFTTALAPESNGTCESGWDVYTFAGDYVPWLETTSGHNLMVSDRGLNPNRAAEPMLVSGPKSPRPTSWAEWVNYANHEDAVWYTMDALLDSLVYSYKDLGLEKNQMTEILYNPDLTQAALAKKESLMLSGRNLSDLAPLSLFPALSTLAIYSDEIKDIRALNALPKLKSLTLIGINNLVENVFDQVPALRQQLASLTLQDFSEEALNRVDWKNLGSLAFLRLNGSSVDLAQLSQVNLPASAELTLESMTIKGLYMPEVMPAGLRLLRVTDSENRPALSWLGQTQGLKNLRMSRMPIESLSRVQDFSDLEQLSIEHMGLTQLDDQLQFPPSVKTVSVSGNKLTSLPAGDAWKRLQELSAYDNPLVDTSCPAAKCNFDRHMSPKNLREYCENVTQWTGFEYGYSNLLWSIIQKGPQEEGGFWTLNCDRIEETARTVKEMYLSNPLLDDIRPLAHLPALESLDLSRSAVRDFSPLASLEMLRAVYLNEIPSFDLTVFKNNIGTRIMGMESQDVSQESCPILAGVCSFVQDEKWTTKYGPILGAQKETTIYQRSEVTLPGVKKSFKTF